MIERLSACWLKSSLMRIRRIPRFSHALAAWKQKRLAERKTAFLV
jgi:hypothetical protein